MNTKQRAAMDQALEALNNTHDVGCAETQDAISALRAALAEQPAEQVPVAWMYEWNGRTYITTTDQRPIEQAHPHFNKSKPLYTAPQPAIPPGYKLVPVEPTPEMWKAVNQFAHAGSVWEAMLAAAHGITGEQS